jgi:competence protein ComFC
VAHGDEPLTQEDARLGAGLFYLRQLFEHTLDLLYPPCCEHCGRADTRWCRRCAAELDAYPVQIVLQEDIPPLEAVASTAFHRGILRDAVHSLKYSANPAIADQLGVRLGKTVRALGWEVVGCIPVPIHRERLRKRRYNQSELLARGMEVQFSLPVWTEALQRERDTQPQVGLNSAERMRNVADAFRCTTSLHGESLLLIDDVCTTGATLAACAAALRAAGAGKLYAVTVTAAAIHSS